MATPVFPNTLREFIDSAHWTFAKDEAGMALLVSGARPGRQSALWSFGSPHPSIRF
jgi:hypothetical protein